MSYGGYPSQPNNGHVAGYPAQAPPTPQHQQGPPPTLNYQPSTSYPPQQQPPSQAPQQYTPQPPPQQQQQQQYPPQQTPQNQYQPPPPQYQQQQQQQPPQQYQPPPPQQQQQQQQYPPQQAPQQYPPQQAPQQYPPQQQQPPPQQYPQQQQYPPQQQQYPPQQQQQQQAPQQYSGAPTPTAHAQPNVVVNSLVGILEVRVLEAEYPKRGFFRGFGNDPYVKVSLGSNHHRTKIFKGATKATHASWYETFDFPNMTGPVSLSIEVMDDDNLTPDSLIGICSIPVTMDKFPSNTPEWFTMTKRDRVSPAGRIQISLRMKAPTIILPGAGVYSPYGAVVQQTYGVQAYGAVVQPTYVQPVVQPVAYVQPRVYVPAPPPVVQVYQQPGIVYQQPGIVYQQPGAYPPAAAPGYYYR